MKPVVCFGEALIDFINKDRHADGPVTIEHFYQFPGGAPANAAVAVAKLGGNSRFLGQVGDDQFGRFLQSCLQTYRVDTRHLLMHPTAKTSLAFVMLDEEGERSFSFYRDGTADMVLTPEQLTAAMFADAGIFHFCSNTLTGPGIAQTTLSALQMAREAGAAVSFDVNLRHNLWASNEADRDSINALVYQSDVLKFSRDELEYLAGEDIDGYITHCLASGCQLLLITDGGKAIEYITPTARGRVASPKVTVVDTTAGGDAFSGGILYTLAQCEDIGAWLSSTSHVEALVTFAAHCGAHVVQKPGAFPALPTFDDVRTHFPL